MTSTLPDSVLVPPELAGRVPLAFAVAVGRARARGGRVYVTACAGCLAVDVFIEYTPRGTRAGLLAVGFFRPGGDRTLAAYDYHGECATDCTEIPF